MGGLRFKINSAKCPPIALFVYDRPLHTAKTLASLAVNRKANQSVLYIYADGPKANATEEDLRRISQVRELIRMQNWCGVVNISESDTNLGLADSIVGGVTSIVDAHEHVIVLEDDISPSPGFLDYMNRALNVYYRDERVMQVSGFMVPHRNPLIPETGFLRVSTSWGWATWKRAWKHFSSDTSMLVKQIEEIGVQRFNLDGYSFHFDELCRNLSGELQTWAVKWYASMFIQSGICLYPRQSLVRNIGFDGSGMHCENDASGYYKRMKPAQRVSVKRKPLSETASFLRAMQSHYHSRYRYWTKTRLRDRFWRKLNLVKNML